jgi:hypothetical protein
MRRRESGAASRIFLRRKCSPSLSLPDHIAATAKPESRRNERFDKSYNKHRTNGQNVSKKE